MDFFKVGVIKSGVLRNESVVSLLLVYSRLVIFVSASLTVNRTFGAGMYDGVRGGRNYCCWRCAIFKFYKVVTLK